MEYILQLTLLRQFYENLKNVQVVVQTFGMISLFSVMYENYFQNHKSKLIMYICTYCTYICTFNVKEKKKKKCFFIFLWEGGGRVRQKVNIQCFHSDVIICKIFFTYICVSKQVGKDRCYIWHLCTTGGFTQKTCEVKGLKKPVMQSQMPKMPTEQFSILYK